MKIVKEYNTIDFARFAFNSNNSNASYVHRSTKYIYEDDFNCNDKDDIFAFRKHKVVDINEFHCEQCQQKFDIKDLKIKDNTIYCECGHTVHVNDLRPYDQVDHYYAS